MNYCSILFFVAIQLTAMEQGALLVQKTALKTVPSLQDIALKAYTKILREKVQKEDLSGVQMIDWCNAQGLGCFFDLNCGDLLPRLKQALVEPTVSKTNLKCPKIFSSDGRSEFINDWHNESQHIVHTDELCSLNSIISMGLRFECGPDHCVLLPIFSPNGRWIIGRKKGKRKTLILMPCVRGSFDFAEICLADDETDYTFFDADTILVRTCRAISMSSIADVVSKGAEALKVVYYRNDMQEYPSPLFFRTVHVLSNSYIACVGPDKKSIEILNRKADGLFSLAKTVKIPNISIGRLVVHNARGVAALHASPAHTTVNLYKLLGDDAGEKSTIEVQHLENYVFSQNGEYLACGTTKKRQVIEIFDCKNLASPQCIQVTPQVVEVGPAQCMLWTERELVVRDGSREKHTVTFSNAAPLIRAYTAYRERQEKEKATSKNAS